ncbi:MAG: MBL fold metallo-hydrolase [Caldisericia bacterium]|nr:MBL fold metallo-hydrolase [Caldisericia bacterium]
MAEVKILVEGYTSDESNDEKTCPTITLIKDKSINLVVDPGVLEDQKILIDKLKENGLSIDDIDVVCITHSHIDHYRNIGMFPNAKTLEYFGLWDKNTVTDWEENFTDDIKIIKTPGHNYDGITLLVSSDIGVIAVCGDVFWKENYPKNDPYASDKGKLEESRTKILQSADFIIPGHAGIYKVKK